MRPIDADALKARINTAFFSEIGKIIDEAPTVSEWIPVSEKLPEQGAVVLICWSGGFITTGCRSGEAEQWLCELDEDNDWCVPVAWMPLPEPYREDGEA